MSKKVETKVVAKGPRWYPAEDIKAAKPTHKVVQNPTKIRSTLTPGTVCIILAGRFRGKRCVFLKSLKSGLLLVSGPYKLNGVPIRRVNQSYIIATSTKIDVSKVDVAAIDDEYFSRSKDVKKDAEDEFFRGDVPKPAVVSDQRKADQTKVDTVLLKTISATPMLEGYLASLFTLKRGDKPHLMKF